jgi:hypothetical protein
MPHRDAAAGPVLDRNISPRWFMRYRQLEADCGALFAFDPRFVHGLVQGEEYQRSAIAADGECDVEVLGQRLETRLERKLEFFGRRGRGITVVFGIEALDPGIGGPGVMRRQLAYLRSLAVPGDMDIRVLPPLAPSAGRFPAFTLLEFDNPPGPPVAYLESTDGATFLVGADEAGRYREAAAVIAAESVPVRQFTSNSEPMPAAKDLLVSRLGDDENGPGAAPGVEPCGDDCFPTGA